MKYAVLYSVDTPFITILSHFRRDKTVDNKRFIGKLIYTNLPSQSISSGDVWSLCSDQYRIAFETDSREELVEKYFEYLL